MLRALVHFSLKFRGVVIVLACVLIGYGIHVSINAKLDVFPNFVQPQVAVQTECPGLAPEQVELLVTRPLETTVNGLGDMESMRSESIEGLSIITAVFKEGTDVFRARQMLAETLAETAGEDAVVILSTHIVSDVSSLCSQMAVIRQGTILASTTPQQAIDQLKDSVWEATVPREQVAAFKSRHQVISSQMFGGNARLRASVSISMYTPSGVSTNAEYRSARHK